MTYLDEKEILNIIINARDTTYLTHNFHPFSAKFIPQIPNLMINKFTKKNDTILDPYCGSGTTLVEAKLLGRNSVGIDIHPLGVFMSKVKTTKLPLAEIKKASMHIQKVERRIDLLMLDYSKQESILSFVDNVKTPDEDFKYDIPNFPNRDHWFQKHVLHELSIIKTSIQGIPAIINIRNFFLLALSSIIVLVSNQESETRYAAIKKEIPTKYPFSLFKNKVRNMINRIEAFNKTASDCTVTVYNSDARQLNFLGDDSVDFILTSPPYPNVYDYYLYHKLRMFFLKMDWKRAKFNEIGSRLRHSSKKESVNTYLRDMVKCFENFRRILKPNKFFTIIIGDSVIRKELHKGNEQVRELAEKTGFDIVDELEYDQAYASRTFNPAFRSKKKKEYIVLLKNCK